MSIFIVTENGLVEQEWIEAKATRDRLIADVDWTQMSDISISEEKKQAFAVYRQALRDIPQQFDNVEDIVWPEKPEL